MRWGSEARSWLDRVEADVRRGDAASLRWHATELDALPAADLLILDRIARHWSYASPSTPMEVAPWDEVDLFEPTGVSAVVASWQRSGFLRESATVALERIGGALAARALALRLLDPVSVVRERARRAISMRVDTSGVADVVDIVVQSDTRGRGGEAQSWVMSWIASEHDPAVVVEQALASHRTNAGRWALVWGLREGVLPSERVLDIALGHRDQWLPPVAAAAVLGMCPDAAEVLSQSSSSAVRTIAVSAARTCDVGRPWFQQLLADRSLRVRKQARHVGRTAALDFYAYDDYVLRAGLNSNEIVTVISEITSTSPAEWHDALRSYAIASSPRVRAAVAQAIGRAWRLDDALSTLVALLGDTSPRVARSAAKALASMRAPASVADDVWRRGDPDSRFAAWMFWSRLGGWEAVRAHLLAISADEPQLNNVGSVNLAAWCRDIAPRMWDPPADDLAAQIRNLLFAVPIPRRQRDIVAFAIGAVILEG